MTSPAATTGATPQGAEPARTPLGLRVKLGYGIGDLGGNLFFTVTAFVLLNYLTDTVGLAAGLAGTALMVGRIWDAFYDPVIGFVSDHTTSRLGRRRPFLLIGSVPLFLTMGLMFLNPAILLGEGWRAGDHQALLFWWVLAVYVLLCTSYSTVNIPYSSLTPELTSDYNERTSLNGYRFGFAVLGTLLGAATALPLVGLFDDEDMGFVVMGTVFGLVMMVTALVTVVSVREPPHTRTKDAMGFVENYRRVFENRPFLLVLAAYVLHIMGITILSGITIYYFKYVLDDEASSTLALLILLGTAMVMIPVSVVVAKRTGKRLAYAFGLLTIAAAVMVIFVWGHVLGIGFTLGMMFVAGIGFGFTYAMPYAMVPDTIEYDVLRTGERREGAFYGVWTWALKIGQALAAFTMGWVLTLSGYVENTVQSDSAELAIRLFLGPVAAVILVLAAVVLIFYPINEERYQEILRQIAEKQGQQAG